MDPIIPQPQAPEPKHFLNKKFIVTFVVLLLLGTGAYAGIWYWQNQQVAQEVVPTFTPRVDTNIYRNSKYGFEITLMQGWVATEGGGVVGGGAVAFRSASYQKLIEDNNNNCSAGNTSCLSEIYGESVSFQAGLGGKDPSQFKGQKTFNGVIFNQYTDGGLFGNYTIYIPVKDGINYEFSTDDKNLPYLDQILSTFKFTDSADTSTWKTYTNTKFGYQFKYPGNVTVEAVDNNKLSRPATETDGAVYIGGLIDITLVNALGRCSDLSTEQAVITCLGSVSWAKVDRWIPITIGGLPAVRREITLKPSPAVGSDIAPVGYIYYINNGNTGFQISAPDSPSQQLLMDQILSTFKFTK